MPTACSSKLSLPIIKGYLRAKIGNSIVRRRKVKYQLKVCSIKKSKISLNRARQGRHVLPIHFFNSIISFRNNIRKWKKKLTGKGLGGYVCKSCPCSYPVDINTIDGYPCDMESLQIPFLQYSFLRELRRG